MRLLLITYTLDESHPALAWQIYVARELAKDVERLYIVTTSIQNDIDLPANVELTVLPVRPLGIPHRFGGRWAFNAEIFQLCRKKHVNAVFIHMAMEWALYLCPTFKALNLPVVLWYAHGTVTRRLKMAIRCSNRVVTSTPEGCRVPDPRIEVIGQAIDTHRFDIPVSRTLADILYVGRISERKRIRLLYDVYRRLQQSCMAENIKFNVVGSPLNLLDLKYDTDIRTRVWEDNQQGNFNMVGHVPYSSIPKFYTSAFLHVNVSETGSMDKTVMEALASGCPVLTSNPAFFDILKDYPEFIIRDDRPEAVAEQICDLHERCSQYKPEDLRNLVCNGHDLGSYAGRVISVIKGEMR